MSGPEDFDEDEISLFDLWRTLKDKWRHVLGGVLLGGLGAAAMITTSQAQYEASALLQTGKVAGTIIEDSSTIVERFKSPSFHLEAAEDVGDPNWAVAPKPVSPKTGLLLALGLVGGLLVGVMSVFVCSAWQRAKAQRSGHDL